MARHATWIERIPVIQRTLEAAATEHLTRRDVEQIFGITRTPAKTLMETAGGRHSKGVWTIAREKLLDYVKFCPEAQEYRLAEQRRVELAKTLQNAEKETQLRRVAIVGATRDEWPTLKQILPKLVFSPGAVTIAHGGVEDLLHTLWLLGQCLGNPADLQNFAEMVETKQTRMKTA